MAKRRSPFRRPPGRPATHGAHALTRALSHVSLDSLDGRTHVAMALRRIERDLVDQVGGDDAITPAQAILVEQIAVRTVITRSVAEWLLKQPTLLREDGAELLKVAMQHIGMQKTLTAMLAAIGLDRRAVPVVDVRVADRLDDVEDKVDGGEA